jgi:hypothetical protein
VLEGRGAGRTWGCLKMLGRPVRRRVYGWNPRPDLRLDDGGQLNEDDFHRGRNGLDHASDRDELMIDGRMILAVRVVVVLPLGLLVVPFVLFHRQMERGGEESEEQGKRARQSPHRSAPHGPEFSR